LPVHELVNHLLGDFGRDFIPKGFLSAGRPLGQHLFDSADFRQEVR